MISTNAGTICFYQQVMNTDLGNICEKFRNKTFEKNSRD